MTNYPSDNGDYLVEVQAQVMTRDHSTQCWVPMGGGGLSIVKLCKLVSGHLGSSSPNANNNTQQKAEYVIHGERLADKSVVLDCVLTKDVQYTKANPKFHHWNSDEKRFGLTFERCDDARAFDHGIRHAVAELNEGTEGEERIFQIVDLPLGRKNSSSQSASTTSTTTNSPSPRSPTPSPLSPTCHDPFQFPHPHPHTNHHQHLHRVHYMPAQHKLLRNNGTTTTAATTNVPTTHTTNATLNNHHHQYHHYECEKENEHGSVGLLYSQRTSSPPPRKSDSLDSWSGGSGTIGEDVWVRYEDYYLTAGKVDSTSLLDGERGGGGGGYKDEPYVIFAKSKAGGAPPHEYSYPSLEPAPHNPHHLHPHSHPHHLHSKPPPAKHEFSTSTLSVVSAVRKQPQSLVTGVSQPHPIHHPHPPPPPLLPMKMTKTSSSSSSSGGKTAKGGGGGRGGMGGEGGEQSQRLVRGGQCARCQHCRVTFSVEENQRGSCDSAPDAVTDCIELVSCVHCTRPLFYHCWADADGQYSHPCQCVGGGGGLRGAGGGSSVVGGGGGRGGCDPDGTSNCCKKWTVLTILSFCLPCLWCYLPLHACHRCGIACGVCGGRHKAA